MRAILGTLALGLSLTAAPVTAQSTGFYYHGYVGMDYLHSSGNDVAAGLVDLTFGVAPESGGSLGGIGFEFGVWGYAMDNGGGSSNDGTLYGAVTFGLGGGRLHVGAPRPGSYGFNTTPFPTGARAALLELGIFTGHLPYATLLATGANRPFIGLRYERESGGLSYAASIGRMNVGGGHVDTLALGAAREFGTSRIFGTIEHFSTPGSDATIATIGGSTMIGGGSSSLTGFEVGGALSHMSGGGSSYTSATLYGTAHVNDRLSVTGSVMHLGGLGNTTIYGLNANYDIWNGVVLNAGVGRATGGGSDTVWTVGLSREF